VKPATLLPLALALALVPAAVRAQPSPRWGSFELGAGTYHPDIDSAFAAPGPYEQVFGGGRGWMFRLGVAKSLYTRVGTLELGLRSGWFRDKGKGLVDSGGTLVKSGDSTTFSVVPSSLTLTYRFDWLVERHGIPFAPYARVAFERYNWWVTDGQGHWAKEGGTNGWSATGGLAFLLDFLEPGAARELDRETGVNHTYLFFDVTKSKVDDFGGSKSWDLSDDKVSLAGGLMFVF
jgi:hypothetical protein